MLCLPVSWIDEKHQPRPATLGEQAAQLRPEAWRGVRGEGVAPGVAPAQALLGADKRERFSPARIGFEPSHPPPRLCPTPKPHQPLLGNTKPGTYRAPRRPALTLGMKQ
jgi:hypothetical protein